jgi:hypothetical protein
MPKSWRDRVRFSVRALMIFVLILGVFLGWIVYRAQVQRDAVAAIRRADGLVRYQWEYNNGVLIKNGKPWWPQWFVRLLGIDYFGHATLVFAPQASDVDLIHIANLSSIEKLAVPGSPVTDAGMARLQGLNNLQNLVIFSTQIGDSGLTHITGLTTLRVLDLRETRISDAGLVSLKRLINLQDLSLAETAISDSGLAHISGLVSLRNLNLDDTRISDAGLVSLKGLTNLQRLSLDKTEVTDAGLEHLKSMNSLRFIWLRNTKVSDIGVKELQRALPNATIWQYHP